MADWEKCKTHGDTFAVVAVTVAVRFAIAGTGAAAATAAAAGLPALSAQAPKYLPLAYRLQRR
ncbi:hypothetical protein CGLO_13631 [Colletotrichum gloeosporioides Cg-14]|uniref:Uncharacterized protein n=1 Tax=Colletotrichum gloeosporioides (strain Cg-14) TaxID=1237896 RepID=T0L6Q7_COLGC|nr:hypothetical protein CGLO_13631 [Colletotrichum gloeosporioides Cg-14]